MQITDPAILAVIKEGKSYGCLKDGLFTVVGQMYLIEMHTQEDFAEVPGVEMPGVAYIIRTSDTLVEGGEYGYSVANSSYTGDAPLNQIFNQHVEDHVFDDQDEAMRFYFAFITRHNHLD